MDWDRGACQVRPAESGKTPRWFGGGGFLSQDMCQAMKRILLSADVHPAWSIRARESIASLREAHAFLRRLAPRYSIMVPISNGGTSPVAPQTSFLDASSKWNWAPRSRLVTPAS